MELNLFTFGSKLRIRNALLLLELPDQTEQTFTPSKIESIRIGTGILISSDALILAQEHDIDVIFEKRDTPICRIWNGVYGSIVSIRRKQLELKKNALGFILVKELLMEKLENQANWLEKLGKERVSREKICFSTAEKIRSLTISLADKSGEMKIWVDTLRGLEGTAGRLYWAALSEVLKDVMPFSERSRKPAKDPFNAILNYAYGMLYSVVENALIRSGLDPYTPIFHADEYNKPAFVYDVIEKYRIWVEQLVTIMALRGIFEEKDNEKQMFLQENNGFWVDQAGKKIIIYAFNEMMNEVIQRNGMRRSRKTHIQLEMNALAQRILKMED